MHRFLIVFILLFTMRCGGGDPNALPQGLKDAYGNYGPSAVVHLHPSPHCVHPGEPITWTLTLTNDGDHDQRLVDTPPLDVLLKDRNGNTVRWSDDPTYPAIAKVIPSHTTQTYTWVWHATTLDGPSRAIVQGQAEWRIDAELNFGINEISGDFGGEPGIVVCESIR